MEHTFQGRLRFKHGMGMARTLKLIHKCCITLQCSQESHPYTVLQACRP